MNVTVVVCILAAVRGLLTVLRELKTVYYDLAIANELSQTSHRYCKRESCLFSLKHSGCRVLPGQLHVLPDLPFLREPTAQQRRHWAVL